MSKNATLRISSREPFFPSGQAWSRAGEKAGRFDEAAMMAAVGALEDYFGFPRQPLRFVSKPSDVKIRSRADIYTMTGGGAVSVSAVGLFSPNPMRSSRRVDVAEFLPYLMDDAYPCSPKMQTLHHAILALGGWVYPTEGETLVLVPPSVVSRDANGRLHDGEGPAVSWRGEDWHFLEGVKVDKRIHAGLFTAHNIDDEPNLEVRGVMLRRLGVERYLRETKAVRVARDEYGTLWRRDRRHDAPLMAVEVLNSSPEPDGTFKTYFLRVPPNMKTPHEAVAWTFGKTVKEYQPIKET